MSAEIIHRPKWPIDQILGSLIGDNVRVAAESFSPTRWNGEVPRLFLSSRELVLPDNSRADGLPLYFEGKLRRFVRQIGVVYVELESIAFPEQSAEGVVYFRGKAAVILRGPAVVKLAFPFRVERLPAQEDNYWSDLHLPCVQFELPLG